MTMQFLVAILFTFSCLCAALPNCCFDPLHYSEILSKFPCNLTCSLKHKLAVDICISCLTKMLQLHSFSNHSNGLDGFNFKKPIIACQTLVHEDNKTSGQVVLTWSFMKDRSPSIFMLEERNSSSEEWNFVGMTNQTVAQINSLEVASEYQFRVTPFVMPNLILAPLISDYVLILDTKVTNSSSLKLTASHFKFVNNSVEATVKWNSSQELPCSYILHWSPSIADEIYGEKAISLPNDTLSAVLSGLSFRTKYTIKLVAMDFTNSQQVTFTESSFVTPSCLTLTSGNFTFCEPGPPLNLSVYWIPKTKAVLSWLPPSYTSVDNQVTGYQLSVIEASEKNHIILRYKESFTVGKEVLNATVSDLKPSVLYFFQVRAVSNVGAGPPAVTQLGMEALGVSYQPLDYVPWHYILPSISFALVVIIAAVTCHLCCRKKKLSKPRGYPSGSADVPNHTLPLLLPSKMIDLQEVIGKGEFGVVHKAVLCRKKSKEVVAVKMFPAESVSRNKLLEEVEILQTVGRHHNVVGLIGFTLDVDKMFLVLEYCAVGNLHIRLRKLKKELSIIKRQLSDPKQPLIRKAQDEHYGIRLCSYIHQVALGMNHISSLKMIHRDLAARNILLCTENHVKIADFGLSRDVYETQCYTMSKQKKLPLRWMAPEAIEKHIFTTQTDVWSFGVLIWEIFRFGKVPYNALCNSAILAFLKSGYRLPKPNATSREWYNLMLECWHINPHKRPTFKLLVRKTEAILSKLCNYTEFTNN